MTLIDNLEIFQAYGNTADLNVDYETLIKLMRGWVWRCELGIRYIITPTRRELFEHIIGW